MKIYILCVLDKEASRKRYLDCDICLNKYSERIREWVRIRGAIAEVKYFDFYYYCANEEEECMSGNHVPNYPLDNIFLQYLCELHGKNRDEYAFDDYKIKLCHGCASSIRLCLNIDFYSDQSVVFSICKEIVKDEVFIWESCRKLSNTKKALQ